MAHSVSLHGCPHMREGSPGGATGRGYTGSRQGHVRWVLWAALPLSHAGLGASLLMAAAPHHPSALVLLCSRDHPGTQ